MGEVDLSDVTLAILAGGQSRRMGTPKTSLQIRGRPILQYLMERLNWPGPTLLVTAPTREHPAGSALFDREAVDPTEGQGPLRGVLTALLHSSTTIVIICTVDMPAIGSEHLIWGLRQLSDSPKLDGLMLRRKMDGRDQIEPFPLACRKSAAMAIEKQLQMGKSSVHALVELPMFAAKNAPIDWPERIWTNLNSPWDYQAFLASEPAD